MTLTATPNEHPSKLRRVRDYVRDMKVAAKPLAAGDYMLEVHGKIVVIEVKWSMGDLLDSLQTKGEAMGTRLGIEVRKMVAVGDIPILLIPPVRVDNVEGKVYRDDGTTITGWEYNSVKGILSDVALYGVIVDEWDGDMAQRLAQWARVLSADNHQWIQQRGRPEFVSLDPLYTEAVWALCAIEKVGPETAEALLAEFGTVRAVMNAGTKALMKVKGVGPIVADNVVRLAETPWKAG